MWIMKNIGIDLQSEMLLQVLVIIINLVDMETIEVDEMFLLIPIEIYFIFAGVECD